MSARVLQLIERYGWNATSFQMLGPGFLYWFGPDGDSVVAYVTAGRYRVVAGAPICAPDRLAETAAAFAADAAAAGQRVIYFACENRLIRALASSSVTRWDWMRVGLQACWDPRNWSGNIASSSTVASQVRRALRKGVEVREIPSSELHGGNGLWSAMEDLVARWKRRHRIAPMQFLVALDSLSYTDEHRYFVALRHVEDEPERVLVGLLVAIPVYARRGYLFENLIVEPPAPNGTGESLVDCAMRAFERENVPYVTMGLVALAGLDAQPSNEPLPTHGGRIRKTLLNAVLRRCYNQLNWFYGFRGLYTFRSRFKPQSWEPLYLAANESIGVRTLLGVLLAFMGNRPSVFALRSLDRILFRLLHPSPREVWAGISAFLAAALVPWILALLASDSTRWFGCEWMAKAWASFDAPVAIAFGALSLAVRNAKSWARPLARLLLGVVLADSWLTLAQACLYSIPHLRGSGDAFVVSVAVIAPLSAALYLILLIRFVNLEQESRDFSR